MVLVPSYSEREEALSRLKIHAQKHYVGKAGVRETRGRFRQNYLFLSVVKEGPRGVLEKMLVRDTMLGVGRLARLEYLGPNRWKFLIYKPHIQKYGPYDGLQEGTIEECLDAAAQIYLT